MEKKKVYRLTGKEGAIVPETTLKKWIQQHEDHHETRAHFFGKEIITKLLSQQGCMGLRIYYAIDDEGKKQLILVGADEKGKNLWPSTSSGKGKLKGGDDSGGADRSLPCPPYC